jgi:hypothetical protein
MDWPYAIMFNYYSINGMDNIALPLFKTRKRVEKLRFLALTLLQAYTLSCIVRTGMKSRDMGDEQGGCQIDE